MSETTTIAALATAPYPAGVGVIRVSGPQATAVLQQVFSSQKSPFDYPRELIFGEIFNPENPDQVFDQVLVAFMPGPKSYTGEDSFEIQFHGNPIIATQILRALYTAGATAARAGEFTERAFLNGKMDLTQAEAVMDLIHAGDEIGLKVATEQLEGKLGNAVEILAEPLRNILAEVEAHIDFPEEDINPDTLNALEQALSKTATQVSTLLSSYKSGLIAREGFRVLLSGRPNAGKSSLLNSFLQTERAIVTEISGTTRDVIEEECLIDGLRFVFCDSAGLRDTEDTVEQIGVELARERVNWANLVLFVADATDDPDLWLRTFLDIRESAEECWLIMNKMDLSDKIRFQEITGDIPRFEISVTASTGIEELKVALARYIRTSLAPVSEQSALITNERHRDCLIKSRTAIEAAGSGMQRNVPLEFISLEIRSALTALEEIIGKTCTEDILGRIFSKFCVGK